jgi:hypothetical protein
VHEKPADPAGMVSWRGAIRHIQSDQELTFIHWCEALDFMQQFLPPNAFDQAQPSKPVKE